MITPTDDILLRLAGAPSALMEPRASFYQGSSSVLLTRVLLFTALPASPNFTEVLHGMGGVNVPLSARLAKALTRLLQQAHNDGRLVSLLNVEPADFALHREIVIADTALNPAMPMTLLPIQPHLDKPLLIRGMLGRLYSCLGRILDGTIL